MSATRIGLVILIPATSLPPLIGADSRPIAGGLAMEEIGPPLTIA
jgi:hypothetical protein